VQAKPRVCTVSNNAAPCENLARLCCFVIWKTESAISTRRLFQPLNRTTSIKLLQSCVLPSASTPSKCESWRSPLLREYPHQKNVNLPRSGRYPTAVSVGLTISLSAKTVVASSPLSSARKRKRS
jgi:hypothetical protein